jgi:hypothetical protein
MFPAGYNTDALGVQFSKKRHDLYTVDIEFYRLPVQWFSQQLVQLGYAPTTCLLVPEREAWFFYDETGEHIFTVAHDQMDHVWDMLRGTFDGA